MSSGETIAYTLSERSFPIVGTQYRVRAGFDATVPADSIGSAHDARIRASFDRSLHDWRIDEYGALALEGARPISTESLREMPVAQTLYVALHSMTGVVVDGNGTDWYDIELRLQDLRPAGPTPANLELVAGITRAARVMRDSPTTTVQVAFGLPARTAAHWLMLARERGHLPDPLDEAAERGWVLPDA